MRNILDMKIPSQQGARFGGKKVEKPTCIVFLNGAPTHDFGPGPLSLTNVEKRSIQREEYQLYINFFPNIC